MKRSEHRQGRVGSERKEPPGCRRTGGSRHAEVSGWMRSDCSPSAEGDLKRECKETRTGMGTAKKKKGSVRGLAWKGSWAEHGCLPRTRPVLSGRANGWWHA